MSTKTNKKATEKEAINENDKNIKNSQLDVLAKKAKNEADELMAKAKKAAIEAKKAAIEAKEAAKKAKAFTSRPVRKCTFEVRDSQNNVITKSDVHYCAEKAAIDTLMEVRATIDSKEWGTYKYSLFKVKKEDLKNEEANSGLIVSQLYIDTATGQIVID